MNLVTLIGNLGKDPELKNFDNGGSVVNFAVANTDRWTDKLTGEKREKTQWLNCVAHNGLAKAVNQYLKKGSKVEIIGKLKTRTYQKQNDKGEMVTMYVTECHVDEIEFLDSKDKEIETNSNTPKSVTPAPIEADTSEVPF